MTILYINNDGSGFADYVQIEANTTVDKFFSQRMGGRDSADYLIRVNRQPVARDYVLQEGDRVSITPTKIEGARHGVAGAGLLTSKGRNARCLASLVAFHRGETMTTIQAKVNTRLLSKASRLFTGILAGRIIEILQNARRARAKRVEITNRDGVVTVRDDGQGIEDFEKLLDLGGSGWEAKLEASEDPAGVGLFCLAPRQLTIRSNGQIVTIVADGWTGSAVEVCSDPQPLAKTAGGIPSDVGTELSFPDEPWSTSVLKPLAAFTGLDATVDGEACPRERFIRGQASLHGELGCRIKVVRENDLSVWHRSAAQNREYGSNVVVNFHGQVIVFSHRPVSNHGLVYLVDMTGQSTGIRLMLPARTCPVENEALGQLKAALEQEAFKYLQRQGRHRLPYKEYLRARELGIELPEAEPVFRVGLLWTDMGPEPIEVSMPKGHALSQCYRLADTKDGQESDEPNVHLLAALGRFDPPFVPVEIRSEYDGYSWATLPTIGRVEVCAGKKLQESWIDGGQLICVDALSITARCSDGKVFRSAVCMAVKPRDGEGQRRWCQEYEVYVTPEAQRRVNDSEVWFHFGGFNDEADTYDTQEHDFGQQLGAFWMRLSGPEEPMRAKLMECLSDLPEGWQSVTIQPDGRVIIRQGDGSEKAILPPRPPKRAEEVRS